MVNSTSRLYSGSILLCIAATIVSVQALWKSFELISIDNSKTGIIATDLKVERFNESTYAITGTLDVTADLNDDYDCEVKAYHSSKGDGKYKLLPFKVARDACCKITESPIWKGVEKSLRESSNLPERNGEKFCMVLKKNVYEMKQFGFNYKSIPMHLDAGTYKAEISLYQKGSPDFSSKSVFVAKLF